MNDQDIVKSMISFIVQKECQLQSNKLMNDQQVKSDVVKAILDELERETTNEDQ